MATKLAPNKLRALSKALDYEFADTKLIELALTHRSLGSRNYERLEFLGDSILGFAVAEKLFQSYPELPEGRLSRMRSSLVRKESLAKIARTLNLSDYLLLGEGELKSGGYNRDSILSDVVESIIGAIYIDSGLDKANAFIDTHFNAAYVEISDERSYKDPKSRLQEVMQKYGLKLPVYRINEVSGEDHNQEFTVSCEIDSGLIQTFATAKSRRAAEQSAAEQALELYQENTNRKRHAGK